MNTTTVSTKQSKGTRKAETTQKVSRAEDKLISTIDKEVAVTEGKVSNKKIRRVYHNPKGNQGIKNKATF